MQFKMYIISKEDELRVGKLLSEHFGKTYLGISAIRTYMPIRHLDEDSKLLFILFPEDFCLNFLKQHLVLHVEVFSSEPMAKSTFEIFNNLISQVGKYSYQFKSTSRNIHFVCSVLADYLQVWDVRITKQFLMEDLETSSSFNDEYFTLTSTLPFDMLEYLGVPVVPEDSSCWLYDPELWKKQFGE